MKDKIVVINGYCSRHLGPFGTSMQFLLSGAFSDMEARFQHIFSSQLDDPKHKVDFSAGATVIFLTTPEVYVKIRNSVPKEGNRFILWNLEPFDTWDNIPKLKTRYDLLKDLVENDCLLDAVWFYNSGGFQHFSDYDNTKYVPVGIHKSMLPSPKVRDKKSHKRAVILLGHLTTNRRRFYEEIRCIMQEREMQYIITENINYSKHMRFRHPKVIDEVSKHKLGLDYSSIASGVEDIRWHRIMFYAACKNTLFSDSDLSVAGFVDGEHYFRIYSPEDFVYKADAALNSGEHIRVANNMYEISFRLYSMTNILLEALRGLND